MARVSITSTIEQSQWEHVNDIANEKFEGNFSQALRSILQHSVES